MARAVVAHINYFFFHSTQSYIHFYLTRFRRTRPVVLTRTPESPRIDPTIPRALTGHFYQYGQAVAHHPLKRHVYGIGLLVRRLLARTPAYLRSVAAGSAPPDRAPASPRGGRSALPRVGERHPLEPARAADPRVL